MIRTVLAALTVGGLIVGGWAIAGENCAKSCAKATVAKASGDCCQNKVKLSDEAIKALSANAAWQRADELLKSWSEAPAKLVAMTDGEKAALASSAEKMSDHPGFSVMKSSIELVRESLKTAVQIDKAAADLCAARCELKGEATSADAKPSCPQAAAKLAAAKLRFEQSAGYVIKANQLISTASKTASQCGGKSDCAEARKVADTGGCPKAAAAGLAAGEAEAKLVAGKDCEKSCAKTVAAKGDCEKSCAKAKTVAAEGEKDCAKARTVAAEGEKECAKAKTVADAGGCAKAKAVTASADGEKPCAKARAVADADGEKPCAKTVAAKGECEKSCAKGAVARSDDAEVKTVAGKGDCEKSCAKSKAALTAGEGEGCAKTAAVAENEKPCPKALAARAEALVNESGKILAQWQEANVTLAAMDATRRTEIQEACAGATSRCPAGQLIPQTLATARELLVEAAKLTAQCKSECATSGKEIPAELKELMEARTLLISSAINVLERAGTMAKPARQMAMAQ